MKAVHIPDVLKTGCFNDHKICRLLNQDESEGFTYAIQYLCESMETVQKYQESYAPKLQQEHTDRYKGRFVAFRTLMEEV